MTKPTEAALRCAREIRAQMGNYHDDEPTARLIDRETNLPALLVVALAAQGVVDARERAHPVRQAIDVLRDALGRLDGAPTGFGVCWLCGDFQAEPRPEKVGGNLPADERAQLAPVLCDRCNIES